MHFLKSIQAFFILLLCASCSNERELAPKDKSPVEETDDFVNSYELETLTDFEYGQEVTSMVFDSNDNLYFLNGYFTDKVYKMSSNGEIETLANPDNLFQWHSPRSLFISSDDELFITASFQNKDVLFFLYKENGVIMPFKTEPLINDGQNYSTSFVNKDKDGNYIIGYNWEVYRQEPDGTWDSLLKDVVLTGFQLQGNLFTQGGGKYFFIIGSSVESVINQARLAYFDSSFEKNYVNSIIDAAEEEWEYGFGDGKLPEAYIGNILAITADKKGDLYFIDQIEESERLRLRKLTIEGVIVTLSEGVLEESNTDGLENQASFLNVYSLAVNSKGDVYIGTEDGLRIAKKVEE